MDYDELSNELHVNNFTPLSSRSIDGTRRTTCEITHQLFQQYIESTDESTNDHHTNVTIGHLIDRHRMFTLMRIRELKRQLDTCLESLAQLRQANHQLQQQQNEIRLHSASNRSKLSCRG